MVPNFPVFRGLRFEDKSIIETFTEHLPPYSDFNFISLWCWNIVNKVKISQLNGNLAIILTDYVTYEPFLTFCGNRATNQTAATLLDYAKAKGLPSKLKLIPHESIAGISSDQFSIREDPNNFDYIMDIDEISYFKGRRNRKHRQQAYSFFKENNPRIVKLNLTEPIVLAQIEDLFSRWIIKKQIDPKNFKSNELLAMRRFFDFAQTQTAITLGMLHDDTLIGVFMAEILKNGYAMSHFAKGEREVGSFQYIFQETARHLADCGCRYINIQEDLGIEGLRIQKRKLHPAMMLKKYEVSKVE